MRFGTCSKDPSRFSRSCVQSVSMKTNMYLLESLLGLNGATWQKWPEGYFLKHSCLKSVVIEKLQFRHTCLHWHTSLHLTLSNKWFWKHFSLRNVLLHVPQYLVSSLVQGGVAVHREQLLSHLCVLSYKVSHALRIYFFAIAAFILVITL